LRQRLNLWQANVENRRTNRAKCAKHPESTKAALSGSLLIQLISATSLPDTPLESPVLFPSDLFGAYDAALGCCMPSSKASIQPRPSPSHGAGTGGSSCPLSP